MKKHLVGSRSLTRSVAFALASAALLSALATPAFAVPVINSFTVDVNPSNENSTINLTATATEDDPVNYTLSEYDFYRVDNGTPVLLQAVSSAGNTVTIPTTTPEVGHAGATITYQVIVKDQPIAPGTGQQAGPASLQETVNDVNHVPTASNGSFSTNPGTPVTVTMTASDPDPEDSQLTYAILTPPPAAAGSLGPVSGNSVVFTPATGFSGTTSFTFQAADNATPSGTSSATISITVVNHPPTATDGSASTPVNVVLNATLTASDPDSGQTLTYTITGGPSHGNATLSGTGPNFTYTPDANFVGNDTFTFTATDSGNPPLTSSPATFTITVNDRAPVASAGPSRTLPAGTSITLNGSASDPDVGDTLTYSWTQLFPAPRNIPLGDPTTLNPKFVAPGPITAQEVYGYQLTVTDSHGATATSTTTITVTNGLPPIANAGADDFASEGTSVTLQGSASDPDNQLPLTFHWTQIGGPLVTLSNPNDLQPSFVAPHVSTETLMTFRLRVTDAGGNFVVDDVTWHILQVGQALPDNPLLSDIAVYPSPFRARSGATIRYHLRTPCDVKITIVDVFGHVVRELENSDGALGGVSGTNLVAWDGRNGEGDFIGNGLYIVQVRADGAGGHARMSERVGVRN